MDERSDFCPACGAAVVRAAAPAPVYSARPASAAPIRNTFANSYLSIIIFASLLFVFFIGGVLGNRIFLVSQNLANLSRQFAVMLPPALAAALTTRAKGPDLSIGSVMTLSGIIIARTLEASGSWLTGLALALAIGAAIGALNGTLTVYLKLPAPAVTGAVYFAVLSICRLLTITPIYAKSDSLAAVTNANMPLGMLTICLLCFIGAFLLIALTRLGAPMFGREKKKR
jgi:Ribose/xylose/arabinose/galactoside ABC-type transport systems, permease components